MIQLAYPWALLALVSIPILLVLHSLRPRRRRLLLSATALWREALRERQRGLGLQKLLRDLSLMLLLLFALLVALGLSGPQWLTRSVQGRDTVLVMDVSASMQADEGGSTRFALAKRRADGLVAELSGGRMAVIGSGRKPVLHSAFESDKDVLYGVLNRLRPTDEAGRPREALALALSLLRNRERARIVFLTDGAFDDELDFAASLAEYQVVGGEQNRNIAITQFDLRPEIGTEERFQVLLTVRNYTGGALDVPASVTLNRQRIFEQRLRLPPAGERTVVVPFRGRAEGRAHARIEVDDDLAADNQAFAVLDVDEGRHVLLVSPGNFYLESVFAALPNVHLSVLEEVSADELALQARRHDLLVFDRTDVPVASLPGGNYLLIDTAPPWPLSVSGSVAYPVIEGNGRGPLVSLVDLDGVRIDAARRIAVSEAAPVAGLQRLFWSEETDLALALLRDESRLVYLGFDLLRSNFPLQAAFPLFIEQSLAWLSPHADRSMTQIAAGEPFRIEVFAAPASVIVGAPSGEASIYPVDDGEGGCCAPLLFDATAETGFYRYRVGEVERYFAVNLTDARESDLSPRARLPEARAARAESAAEAQLALALWPYFAAFALLLLALEWGLWCMRRGHA